MALVFNLLGVALLAVLVWSAVRGRPAGSDRQETGPANRRANRKDRRS